MNPFNKADFISHTRTAVGPTNIGRSLVSKYSNTLDPYTGAKDMGGDGYVTAKAAGLWELGGVRTGITPAVTDAITTLARARQGPRSRTCTK